MFSFFSLMLREIGFRQGKVHWKVRRGDWPEFGHCFDFISEVFTCICLSYIPIQIIKVPPFNWFGVLCVVA